MSKSMQMQIDFLRFTWKPSSLSKIACESGSQGVLSAFFDVFPEFQSDELTLESYVSEKYQHFDYCLHLSSGIAIFYDAFSTAFKGVSVFLPSGGLWVIPKIFHHQDFRDFLRDVYFRKDVKFTRIDICFDDYDYREKGHFIAEDFCKWNMDGLIVSSARLKQGYLSAADTSRMVTNGRSSATFYLGTRTTKGRMLRIYDKYYESAQKAKKYNDPSLFRDCVRYEFEIGSRYADSFIQKCWIQDNLDLAFADFCNDWFRVLEKRYSGNNSEKSPVSVEWEEFLNSSLNSQVSRNYDTDQLFVCEKKPLTYDRAVSWLDKCVVPILASLVIANQRPSWLIHKVKDYIDSSDISPSHRQLISDYCKKSFDDALIDFKKFAL